MAFVVVFAGLVLWAGEVAHAIESTTHMPGEVAVYGVAPSEDDHVARHLDEGGGARRGDAEPCAVVPIVCAEDHAGAGIFLSFLESAAHDGLHRATPDARGPPSPT